ncbi:SMP-30/gluconolactonase/LRE family protein [Microbacterium sp. CIAB417]|uniref:SMP-30/gluconolactonase/LRE family protein n=1 Tax=Microbacterium sp. CIAB417 TaxID=2860287 RepID=UPI001FAD8147|nr:SMP-30/gluconolactonase/LRE family protein [Microbacterium sp. CIAB417]
MTTALIRAGILPSDASLERVHTGSIWAEGPLWIPDRGRLRFSDIPNDCIREYDPVGGETSVYAQGVEFTNGRTRDRDGSVLQCSHGRRRVERDRDGIVENVVDSYAGVRLNSPNDIVVAGDGSIWFTDPAYGITQPREGHPGEREYGDHFVFRHDPATGRTSPVITDIEQPNGLAFSRDGSLLYVADSSERRDIRVYDVQEGARCKNGRLFAVLDAADGIPDGIRVDEEDRIWSSSGTGVIVFAPDGTEIGRIPVPEITANLCFGGPDGRDLYITATTSLYRIRTRTHG